MKALTYIKIETIRSGQPRKYADSEYVYHVSQGFSWDGSNENFKTLCISEEQAVSIIKTQRNFVEAPDTIWGARLDYCKPVTEKLPNGAKVWEVRIVEPFTD